MVQAMPVAAPQTLPSRVDDAPGPVLAVVDQGTRGSAAVHLATRLAGALELPALATIVLSGELERAAVLRARRRLREAAAEVGEAPETVLMVGAPAWSIRALARREAASLVVVGAGDGGLQGPALGVVQDCAAPVVFLGPRAHAHGCGPVLVGALGSQPALGAAALATTLAAALTTTVSHIRVPVRRYARSPASALARAATDEDAQLLVVEPDGPDDRGDGSPLLPQLVRAAPCPVVVTPRDGDG
jgi:nucleotide-binding universal stress UspA family protein